MLTPRTPARLVVFDVAGTTVLDGGLVIEAMGAALKRSGVHVEQTAIKSRMGLAKPIAIRELISGSGERVRDLEALVREVHAAFLEHLVGRYRVAEVREADGAHGVFLALHERGIKVALDTGFSRPILDVLLDRMGWSTSGLVDCSVTSDEVPRGRPAPDLIRQAMRLTGVTDAGAVAKVGDTPADIESGRAASCGYVVAVAYGTHSRAELQRHDPDAVIDRLSDLLPLVTAPL